MRASSLLSICAALVDSSGCPVQFAIAPSPPVPYPVASELRRKNILKSNLPRMNFGESTHKSSWLFSPEKLVRPRLPAWASMHDRPPRSWCETGYSSNEGHAPLNVMYHCLQEDIRCANLQRAMSSNSPAVCLQLHVTWGIAAFAPVLEAIWSMIYIVLLQAQQHTNVTEDSTGDCGAHCMGSKNGVPYSHPPVDPQFLCSWERACYTQAPSRRRRSSSYCTSTAARCRCSCSSWVCRGKWRSQRSCS